VVFASGYVFYAGSVGDYFLPQLVGNALLAAATLVTILIDRPLAAWLSHLTRGF